MGKRKKLLRETELAEEFGFKVKTLRNDRSKTRRLPYVKIGSAVYYDPIKVQEAVDAMSFPRRRLEE